VISVRRSSRSAGGGGTRQSPARIAAANAILDRGWGKATQAIQNGDDGALELIHRIERVIVASADRSRFGEKVRQLALIDLALPFDALRQQRQPARFKFLPQTREEAAGLRRENLSIAGIHRPGDFEACDSRD